MDSYGSGHSILGIHMTIGDKFGDMGTSNRNRCSSKGIRHNRNQILFRDVVPTSLTVL